MNILGKKVKTMIDMKQLNKLLQEKVDEIYKICEENGIESLSIAILSTEKYASFFNNYRETDKNIDNVKINGEWYDFKGE